MKELNDQSASKNNSDTKNKNIIFKIISILLSFLFNSVPFIVILVFSTFIIPLFMGMFESANVELPLIHIKLFQVSNFIVGYCFLYIIASFIMVVLITLPFARFYIQGSASKIKILLIHFVCVPGLSVFIALFLTFLMYMPIWSINGAGQ